MKNHARRATRLLGLLIGITLIGTCASAVFVKGQQAPLSIRPDSSAVVIVVDNQTTLPVQVALKIDTAYLPQGWCPPQQRCLYVVPSARLGTLSKFRLGGMAFGERQWDDSEEQVRVPGQVNVVGYKISQEVPKVPRGPTFQTG